MKPWERLLLSWSPEKAWFLGIIYGDGNIYRNPPSGDYRVSACGSKSTTTRWIALLDPSRTPLEFKRSPGTYQTYVNDKGLVEWFEREMGMCGPKADSLVWPEDLPLELERDFIRGLWDSDGSIFIESRRHRKARGNDTPRAKYDSKCESFVVSLERCLRRNLNLPVVAVPKETKVIRGRSASWYTLKYGGRSAMLVADWLYKEPPPHLVNDDRLDMYRVLCRLRDVVDEALCVCGELPTHEGFCQKCWWVNHGKTTGVGIVCSTEGCGKSVVAKGLCTACYNRLRRQDPNYQRKSTGACSCGSPAFRKGLCDRCYSVERRKCLQPT
jgi:hypothetical protein